MSITEVGIYLWLVLYQIGEPIRDTVELERTWFQFESIEHCVKYSEESDFIWQQIMKYDQMDWVFALCLDPKTANRTYILPTYAMTDENPTGDTPLEQQEVIITFEDSLANYLLPDITGLAIIPDKKYIWKKLR